MAYRVAAVDVHKKMLAVVVADIAGEGEYQFERRKFGATGEVLEAGAPEPRGGRQDVRRAAPMPGGIQPRAARAEK